MVGFEGVAGRRRRRRHFVLREAIRGIEDAIVRSGGLDKVGEEGSGVLNTIDEDC